MARKSSKTSSPRRTRTEPRTEADIFYNRLLEAAKNVNDAFPAGSQDYKPTTRAIVALNALDDLLAEIRWGEWRKDN